MSTYRIEGLPPTCTHADAQKLIEAAVGLNPQGGSVIRVHSLAKSAIGMNKMTATVSSALLDTVLQSSPGLCRHFFQIKPPPASSIDGVNHANEIILDTVFDGFTPLNSFANPQEHQFEYVCPVRRHVLLSRTGLTKTLLQLYWDTRTGRTCIRLFQGA
jgi:hypothetical protein